MRWLKRDDPEAPVPEGLVSEDPLDAAATAVLADLRTRVATAVMDVIAADEDRASLQAVALEYSRDEEDWLAPLAVYLCRPADRAAAVLAAERRASPLSWTAWIPHEWAGGFTSLYEGFMTPELRTAQRTAYRALEGAGANDPPRQALLPVTRALTASFGAAGDAAEEPVVYLWPDSLGEELDENLRYAVAPKRWARLVTDGLVLTA